MNFWQFFKICNFVLFWLGIWCESLVWVIMGWQGRGVGISERRCSSCSSYSCLSWGRISNTCAISVLRNGMKLKYLSIFKPLQCIKGSKLLLIINYRFPLYEKRKIFLLYALRMTLERYDSRLHAASTLSHVYYLQPLSVSDVTGIEHYHHEKTQQ